MADAQPDLVILVHGTFASSPEDTGPGWWQCDSDFWKKLNHRLGGKARCTGPGEVFHWTGANRESDRRKASHQLASLFEDLELKGQPFHVIAHSHGGNVLLSALFLCAGRLQHLRSWSTVGTPYFRYHGRIVPPPGAISSSLVMFCGVLLFMGATLFHSGMLADQFPDIQWVRFSPTVELWLYRLTTVLSGAMFLFGLIRVMAKISRGGHAAQAWMDERFRRQKDAPTSHAWLALWSHEDEAVRGLTGVCHNENEILPRAAAYTDDTIFSVQMKNGVYRGKYGFHRRPMNTLNRLSGQMLDRVSRWCIQSYEKFTITLSNRLCIPFLDWIIRTKMRDTAFGRDVLGTEIRDVMATPFDLQDSVPSIPHEITEQMVQAANEGLRSSQLLSQARSLIAQATLGGMSYSEMAGYLSGSFKGSELVHTGYFDQEAVVEMLALHIEISRGDPPDSAMPSTRDWIQEFYSKTGQRPMEANRVT